MKNVVLQSQEADKVLISSELLYIFLSVRFKAAFEPFWHCKFMWLLWDSGFCSISEFCATHCLNSVADILQYLLINTLKKRSIKMEKL